MEAPGPINGYTDGRGDNPEISIDLDRGDRINGISGRVIDQCCWFRAIISLAFQTVNARNYGPYGGTTLGSPFSTLGNVYGIYGTSYSDGRTPSSIGIWTDSPAGPPLPPAPTTPRPPSPLPTPLARSKSQLYGNSDGPYFDDGPNFLGEPP